MTDFAGLLDATEPTEFTDDPRPGWAGPSLLFGGAHGSLKALPPSASVLAAGVPFDGTSSSRPGAAEGPAAIRQASLVFSSYIDSLGEHEMYDMRTREVFRYQRRDIVDVGDLHVYQTDTVRTFRAVASEVRAMTATGAKLLLLGGDHSISFPTFAGWRSAMAAAGRAERLGYVQVDHHFDFGNESAIHGPLYHGSNARRISELPAMSPRRMAFVGVGSVTRNAQLQRLLRDGYHIIGARQVKELGARSALQRAVSALKAECDAIYLSIDIDVLDCSVAPGTGNVTIGGLSGSELFDVLSVLSLLPVDAFDITEVSPRYDPSGRTVQIAARLLFEFIYRRVPFRLDADAS
jgi:arginase family enzyme